MIPKEQARIKSFRQQHGSTAIGQITVDMVRGGTGMGGHKGGGRAPVCASRNRELRPSILLQVYGGMRGMKGLIYETSVLDPDEVGLPHHPRPTGAPVGQRC